MKYWRIGFILTVPVPLVYLCTGCALSVIDGSRRMDLEFFMPYEEVSYGDEQRRDDSELGSTDAESDPASGRDVEDVGNGDDSVRSGSGVWELVPK